MEVHHRWPLLSSKHQPLRMRGPQQTLMIGSVLCYVLYPLFRYLAGRPAEASEKRLAPALTNGKAACDGGAATTRRFTQSRTTLLLDQSLSQGETKERTKETSPEKEDCMRPLYEVSEVQSAVKEKEMESSHGAKEANVEDPKQDAMKRIHHQLLNKKQKTEDEGVFPNEDIHPKYKLQAQLERLVLEDSTQETMYSVQKTIHTPELDEAVTPAELNSLETTGLRTSSVAQSMTPAKTAAEVTECWDEYVAVTADEMHGRESSKLSFSPLRSNSRTQLKLSRDHDRQTSWHFPAGSGLTEEVQCPLWPLPAMSYYPQVEPLVPFEVIWRVWEERDESAAEPTQIPFQPFKKAFMDFTVMSYNILADDLLKANQELYTHCPLEVLDWSYRCSLVLEEILKWGPDILCLQEVQENHYYEHLYPVLSQRGYTCVYKRRTGTNTDGCATCYHSRCFSEFSVTLLEFYRPGTELLDRHNVGIVLLLRPVVTRGSDVKAMGPPLCVANTHLLFNPRRGDIKLAQLAIMLAEIDRVVRSCKANGEHCNLLLCGDFNAVPGMPLYQLITTGELYFQNLPAWMISGQEDLSHRGHYHRLFAPLWPSCLGISHNCRYTTDTETLGSQSRKPGKCQYSHDFLLQLRFGPATCVRPHDLELIPGVTDKSPDISRDNHQRYNKSFSHTLRHRLDLESVYSHILPGSGSPEVTTLHAEGGASVDYIFYTPRRIICTDPKAAAGGFVREGLKLVGALSLLSEDVLWSLKGLPNDIFPSDHLSLVAKFQMELNVV